MKLTVPVGVPAAGETGSTVAVKVICCPRMALLPEDARLTADVPWLTVWAIGDAVAGAKWLSPL
jgi:hypothetical protein